MSLTATCSLFHICLAATLAPAIATPEPPAKFEPNYIAVQDVELSTPNGNAAGYLKKGTLVSARLALEGVLNVQTTEGQSGLASASAFSRLGRSISVTPASKSAAKSSNQFAVDLYHQVRSQEGNLFLSPASVATALAMTHAGAAGVTKTEIAKVLHLEPGQHTDAGFAVLMELLNSTGDRNGYQLNTANRLWGDSDAQFETPFLQLVREQYHAPLESLDFGKSQQARETINRWVLDQTRGRIADLIPQGMLNAQDRLVLTNAIFFQGGWQHEFEQSATKPAPFHVSPDVTVETPMMSQQESFSYTEDEMAQVVSLPYRGHEVSMVVMLPKQRDGLAMLEATFTEKRLSEWLRSLNTDRLVRLHLPRIKLESQLMLTEMLKAMGMKTAFDESANFTAMSKSESLMISQVIHQANVDVDEKGTEAVAATAIIMALPTAPFDPEPKQPVVFRADHPFLFLIRENRSGAILFLGRVTKPTS
ncbi:MAG TPA: serpin family protein [Planctomycetaceae bacterium]|nr:serpin family protein [Planctomycetaceae bacterium]